MIPNTQRIKLLSIVAFLTVAACTTTNKPDPIADEVPSADTTGLPSSSERQPVQVDTAKSPPGREVALSEETMQWSDSLQKHFDPGELALLGRAVSQSKAIVSAADLAQFYQGMLRDSIQPLVETTFQAGCRHSDYGGFADDDWDWISEAFPFIATRVSCHNTTNGTECIHQAPISLLPLKGVALRTPQPEDDLFFDVLIAIHSGTEPGSPVEMEVYDGRVDYTAVSENVGMLGDGHTSEFVRKMSQAASTRKLFNKALTADLRDLMRSLQEERYYHSKTLVLSELEEIIATGTTSKLLTSREISALQETRHWVEEKQEGFDCGTVGCDPAPVLQEP